MTEAAQLRWKARRLLAMTPAEVALRAARGVSHRLARPNKPRPQGELAGIADVLARGFEGGASGVAAELDRTRASILAGGVDADALRAALAEIGVEARSVTRAANKVLAGSVPAFGWTSIETGTSPDWHRDPVSGERWPLEYWCDLNFRSNAALGDPRQVWEVNRQHYLVTLARAHALTGEARYAERVWRDICSWIDANPPFFGINWVSPLESAIRLISWAMAIDLIGSSGASDGQIAAMTVSVSLQARHVSDNLSLYASSRNNHLIGEAAGLAAVGFRFPFLAGSGGWLARGERLVEREVIAQVSEDGVSREQAFEYGSFVLEFGLLSAAIAARSGTRLAPDYTERLRRMAHFLSAVGGEGFVVPPVGDGDGGRVHQLSDRGDRRSAGAAACASVVCGGTPAAWIRPSDFESCVWLLGPEKALEGARQAGGPRDSGATSAAFQDGGYFVASGRGQHGVIDCGPLGYLSIAAHGHADCLSLCVCQDGRWVIVDPGTYCYHRDAAWRNHFRGTPAHNTVSVDGASQSEMLGPFMWIKKARARQIAWVSTDDFDLFKGEHDGYGAVTHRRTVLFGRPGYWLVVDTLAGAGRHDLSAGFQLAADLRREPGDDHVFADDGGRGVRIYSWLPPSLTTRVREGQAEPRRGWVSPGFGGKVAAPAVLAEGNVELPTTLVFGIVPFTGARAATIECLTGGWTGGAAFEIEHRSGRDVVRLGAPEIRGARERFDGTLGFIAERPDGARAHGFEVTEWSLSGSAVEHHETENRLFG